ICNTSVSPPLLVLSDLAPVSASARDGDSRTILADVSSSSCAEGLVDAFSIIGAACSSVTMVLPLPSITGSGQVASVTVLRTPQQNGVVKRRNRTLVEAARTMLIFSKAPIENVGKLQPTADVGIFVGYAPSRMGYRIYNKQNRRIMETIPVQFDELTEQMAPVQLIPVPVNTVGTPSSTTIDQDAPCPSHSLSSLAFHSLNLLQGVAAESTIIEDNPLAPVNNDPFVNVFASEPSSEASSSGDVSSVESTYVTQTHYHLKKLSKDHLLDNVTGNPSRPVSTRKQLATDALWCFYNSVLSKVKPKNFKSAITEDF
nr:integrase, catalytic region, zinc finger, CCHC-type, peptidase aspartic, catalytic [Tanacetum cinerariifolium]